MEKIYTALGLMSGTSMDGVDVSIIKSNGFDKFDNIFNEYREFDHILQQRMLEMRNLLSTKDQLIDLKEELKILERDITIFHSELVNDVFKKYGQNIDLVGFHGQTIFHDAKNKISKQLGDGKLLSQLIKKKVVYDFRQNDLNNGGQGAPLTPIFHNLLVNNIFYNHKSNFYNVINIGGISNITYTVKDIDNSKKNLIAFDIGPGNCLIDEWVRKNSNKKFDKEGMIGKSGKVDNLILNQAIENFRFTNYEQSLDIKDFDISFAKGLSLEDGCATITNFTAYLISEGIKFTTKDNDISNFNYLICGGGRKNIFLIELIKEYLKDFKNVSLKSIDFYNYDGDFIESQGFGYLAIRSSLKLPITFPTTTRCEKAVTGGKIVKNY